MRLVLFTEYGGGGSRKYRLTYREGNSYQWASGMTTGRKSDYGVQKDTEVDGKCHSLCLAGALTHVKLKLR